MFNNLSVNFYQIRALDVSKISFENKWNRTLGSKAFESFCGVRGVNVCENGR